MLCSSLLIAFTLYFVWLILTCDPWTALLSKSMDILSEGKNLDVTGKESSSSLVAAWSLKQSMSTVGLAVVFDRGISQSSRWTKQIETDDLYNLGMHISWSFMDFQGSYNRCHTEKTVYCDVLWHVLRNQYVKFLHVASITDLQKIAARSPHLCASVIPDDPRCCCFDHQRRALLEQDQPDEPPDFSDSADSESIAPWLQLLWLNRLAMILWSG